MKNYVVIYHVPAEMLAAAPQQSQEEMAESMKPWMVWAEKCGEQLVDMGSPLAGGMRLSPDGSSAPSTQDVAGYSILKANSMEEAKSLLKGHPHLAWGGGCKIEVHEAMPLPGM